jgi:two-component system OmpR family sensor kinase
MTLRRISLRTRLTGSAVLGGAIALAVLVLAFNLVLDARLRADRDQVLRERASTVLRGLGTVNGRLSVLEAPDQAAVDTQAWIFVGANTLERPPNADPRNQRAAVRLAAAKSGFATVQATDTRLYAVPVRRGGRPLGAVVVAASLSPYESTASSALLGSIILGLLMLAALAALARRLVNRALRPVAQMTAQAADWGEHDLSRRFFAGDPHDELSSLASVFDGLLARLGESLSREQRLTSEISHELRTPLAKVLAEAELAAGRDRPAQEYRASLESIGRHAWDLQRVLETLLASARAAVPGRTAASDAAESARRAAAPLQETLAAQGKSIDVICTRPARVAADADLVQRILAPMLENAARYARHRITLEIRAADGEVIFEIRDDGPGVGAGELDSIFDPGFAATDPDPDGHRGAGLGLPLARRLARAAGGDLDARASSEGGSFAVRLPTGSARHAVPRSS